MNFAHLTQVPLCLDITRREEKERVLVHSFGQELSDVLEPFCLHPIDGKSKSFMVAAFSSHIGKSIHGSTRYKKPLSL